MARIQSYKLNAKHQHKPTLHSEASISRIGFTPIDGVFQFSVDDEAKGRSFRVKLDEADILRLAESQVFQKAVAICKERAVKVAGF